MRIIPLGGKDRKCSSNFSLSKTCIRILSISMEIEPNRGKIQARSWTKKIQVDIRGNKFAKGGNREEKEDRWKSFSTPETRP